MLAVSNTSPLSNLAIIGRLELLQDRYGSVRIPLAVARELAQLTHPGGKSRLDAASAAGWLQVDPSVASLRLPFKLDAGETAAITLAVAVQADILLIDEKRGRLAARHCGLTVAGVLGELLHARLAGKLPLLKPEFDRLRREAGFFIDSGIERFLLSQVGE
jgi:predicted nucleic acid-binding protein